MRVTEIYAANLRPGMQLAGVVNRNAPTTPFQPFASVLTVKSVERVSGPRAGVVPVYWPDLRGDFYPLTNPDAVTLVIVEI